MATKRQRSTGHFHIEEDNSVSSPDPLALSPPPSTLNNRLSSPLRSTSGNVMGGKVRTGTPVRSFTSPSKTITMSTGKSPSGSPWKIKVTVEAQPEHQDENGYDANDPFVLSGTKRQTRSRTVRIPLKDHNESPTIQPRQRSKTPVAGRSKRAGTPMRRKRRSITRIDSDEESQDDALDQDFSLKPQTRRGRRKMSISNVVHASAEISTMDSSASVNSQPGAEDSALASPQVQDGPHDDITGLTELELVSPPTHSTISPPATASPLKATAAAPSAIVDSPLQLKAFDASAVCTPDRTKSRPSFNFTKLTPAQWPSRQRVPPQEAKQQPYTIAGAEQSYADEDDESDDDDDDDIEPAEAEIGERTMMESEGFSMVSLESVESARDLLHVSPPPSVPLAKSKAKSAAQPGRIVSISTTVSSGEEHPSGLLTPSTSSFHGDVTVEPADDLIIAPGIRATDDRPGTPSLLHSVQAKEPSPPRAVVNRHGVDALAETRAMNATLSMQTAVNDPSPPPMTTAATPQNERDESLLHGFSASTKKQLREGLRFGESLARMASDRPASASDCADDSVRYPRLPLSGDRTLTSRPTLLPPMLDNIGVPINSYIPTKATFPVNSTTESTSNMSWRPSQPPVTERPTCVSPDSMEAQWRREREAVSAEIRQADPSEVITVSSEEDDSVNDMQPADECVDSNAGNRSRSHDSQTISARPHLSRTGRRSNSVGLAYRDESQLGSSSYLDARTKTANTFWQPGTVLEPASHAASTLPGRRTSGGFRRVDSGSTTGSTTSTATPGLEETEITRDEVESTSEESIETPIESPDESASEVSNDTGLFWHRNLPSVYSKDQTSRESTTTSSNLKGDKIDLSALLKLQTPLEISPLRTPGHGLRTPHRQVTTMTSLTPGKQLHTPGLKGVLKAQGNPLFMSGSPAKDVSRVSFADVDETRTISFDGTSELDVEDSMQRASTSMSDTMSSDVRQLYDEMNGVDGDVSVNTEEHSDGLDESQEGLDSSQIDELSRSVSAHSRLRASSSECNPPKDDATDLTISVAPSSYSLRSHRVADQRDDGYSRTDATVVQDIPAQEKDSVSAGPGIISRFSKYLWSYAQTTATTPVSELSHSLLKDKSLSLLPRIEPWTKTHYKMLDRLYQRYKRQPELFDLVHPDNASLAALIHRKQRYRSGIDRQVCEYSFADFIDCEMKNWGYTVRLTSSHVVIAALFSQLLVLDDMEQYEKLVGEKINVGRCNPGTPGEELGVDKVVFRLFSIIHGEKVRRTERRGEVIERRKGTGFLRFSGSADWVNYM